MALRKAKKKASKAKKPKGTVLSRAPLVRLLKESGVERVAGFDLEVVVTESLKRKFKALAKLLKAQGKKTLSKEMLEAALA